jgi:hypothetical protein
VVERTFQEQLIREAPEIEAIKLGLLADAKLLADQPIALGPGSGVEQKIASLDPLIAQAAATAAAEGGIGDFRNLLTMGRDTLTTGLGTLGGALTPIGQAEQAAAATSGLFEPSDLSAYMNPFQQSVIDETMRELNRQGEIQQTQLGARAAQAGAFGDRYGQAQAELGRNLQDARARALAQLNAQNFQQALGTAQASFENQQRRQQQQAQILGQMGQLRGILGQAQAGIGGQQIGAGEASQRLGLQQLQAQTTLGRMQQAQEQAELDADRQNRMGELYEPYRRVSFLSDIYKGAPSSTQSTSNIISPSPPAPSFLQTATGIGTGLLGATAAGKQLDLF